MRMYGRSASIWVVAALLAWAGSATLLPAEGVPPTESTQPPKQGHWVRGHWTPYEPPDPAAFPEGTKVHSIVAGDTLWDLAATYLGDLPLHRRRLRRRAAVDVGLVEAQNLGAARAPSLRILHALAVCGDERIGCTSAGPAGAAGGAGSTVSPTIVGGNGTISGSPG